VAPVKGVFVADRPCVEEPVADAIAVGPWAGEVWGDGLLEAGGREAERFVLHAAFEVARSRMRMKWHFTTRLMWPPQVCRLTAGS
jgi:hypothetical protein